MIYQGHIVDIIGKRIFDGTVSVRDGRIEAVREEEAGAGGAALPYILPGFIDSHVHIESSMLTPVEFARMAVTHGTIGTVSDPHEIANVLGMDGVRYMIGNASGTPFNFCFGAPSCVPSCSPGIETSGAVLGREEVEEMLGWDGIGYLSEVMNFPGVLNGDEEVMAKIACAVEKGKRIDGHAPGLTGKERAAYAACGISTDHECSTVEEGRSCILNGMSVLIREGSAARNYDALLPLLAEAPGSIMFCCDDIHPGDLEKGHIDMHVRRALAEGYDLWDVLRAASLNPQLHYALDWGLLREGDPATFIMTDSLGEAMKLTATVIDGMKVFDATLGGEAPAAPAAEIPGDPAAAGEQFPNRFEALPISEADIADTAEGDVSIIIAQDGQLFTSSEKASRSDGTYPWDEVQKIVVLNRYAAHAAPAVGHVRGFGLRNGAMAASIAHDCHNIVAIGSSDEAIVKVVNEVVRMRGGIAACCGEGSPCSLELPIAGLMSPLDAHSVSRSNERILKVIADAGCTMSAPLITMSFMCLPVIPELKITDKGPVSLI